MPRTGCEPLVFHVRSGQVWVRWVPGLVPEMRPFGYPREGLVQPRHQLDAGWLADRVGVRSGELHPLVRQPFEIGCAITLVQRYHFRREWLRGVLPALVVGQHHGDVGAGPRSGTFVGYVQLAQPRARVTDSNLVMTSWPTLSSGRRNEQIRKWLSVPVESVILSLARRDLPD